MVAENHIQTRFRFTATHTTTPTHQHGAQPEDKTHMSAYWYVFLGGDDLFLNTQRPKCLFDFVVCFLTIAQHGDVLGIVFKDADAQPHST